jgi:hypothetical protein
MKEMVIRPKQRGKFITLRKEEYVYKRVQHAIVQLLLPAGTVVAVPTDYSVTRGLNKAKLRANQAIVLAIIPFSNEYDYDRRKKSVNYYEIKDVEEEFRSKRLGSPSHPFMYKIGARVVPQFKFFSKHTGPCHSGIHFFTQLKHAENW